VRKEGRGNEYRGEVMGWNLYEIVHALPVTFRCSCSVISRSVRTQQGEVVSYRMLTFCTISYQDTAYKTPLTVEGMK